MTRFLLSILLSLPLSAMAQYPPQAGVSGSTAISVTDKRIVAWADKCEVKRGWQDINDKSKGFVNFGTEADALGAQDGKPVSLGDSGIAVITFPGTLYNGPGPDFAVFEFGFTNPANAEEAFMELAFVEVSSDGVNYTRFPANCVIPAPQIPGAGVYMNARKVNNLAGKYVAAYGTPFDLEELKGTAGLNVDKITHVRLVDVIGSLTGVGSKDVDGNTINDPYPTAFPTGGFDLDAVAALNIPGRWPGDINEVSITNKVRVYPNPANSNINIQWVDNIVNGNLSITDVTGRTITKHNISGSNTNLDISQLANGVYFLILNDGKGNECKERFIKY